MIQRLRALWNFSARLVASEHDEKQAEEIRQYTEGRMMAKIIDMTPDTDFEEQTV